MIASRGVYVCKPQHLGEWCKKFRQQYENCGRPQQSYSEMAQVLQRLTELIAYQRNRLAYRKRTEIMRDVVEQLEIVGEFPNAHYAFNNGVLTLELTQLIEGKGKHWVSEIECSRLIVWNNQWQRVDAVAAELRQNHSESFRPVMIKKRNGEQQKMWAFTKVVRLRRYGRKRLVMVHEQPDLSDPPRFLLTDAQYWESTGVIETWSYRWSSEIFHEFTKQVTGLESAQVRNEQAVKRHLCLSCLAQSLLQQLHRSRWEIREILGKQMERKRLDKGSTPSHARHWLNCWNLFRHCLQQGTCLAKSWRC